MASALLTELTSPKEPGRDITRPILIAGARLPIEDKILTQYGAGDVAIGDDLLRHPAVYSAFKQVRAAIVSKETIVAPGDTRPIDEEAATFIREQIAQLGQRPITPRASLADWDRVTEQMLYAPFYGWAVSECLYRDAGNRIEMPEIRVRRQRRFRFDANERLLLRTFANPLGEVIDEERKFWVFSCGAQHSDDPYGGGGLLPYLYWPVYISSNVKNFWLRRLEKYGGPTVAFESGEEDKSKLAELVATVANAFQNEGVAAFPPGTLEAVKLLESAKSTEEYLQILDLCRKDIVQVILTQTMTSDTAVRGSTEIANVHEQKGDETEQSIADQLMASFVSGPVAWLTEWNFPGAVPPRVFRQFQQAEDVNQTAERDEHISHFGYRPAPERVAEIYGEGYVPVEPAAPILPGASGDQGGAPGDGTRFAEGDAAAAARLRGRLDQQGLMEAAREMARCYEAVIGPRLDELYAQLRDDGDLASFSQSLSTLLKNPPTPAAIETVHRGSLIARLQGKLRGARRRAA